MGETLNGTSGLNIDGEVRVVEEKLKHLHAQDLTEAAITMAMKDIGLLRYFSYSLPN